MALLETRKDSIFLPLDEVNTCHWPQQHSKKVILIVDDNEDLLTLYRLVLELEGYNVVTALGGKEALATLGCRDTSDEWGLILLDMRMDDMSGPEFLDLVEREKPEILDSVPVVFLTALDRVPQGRHQGFLRKPIENLQLVETVRYFLR